MEILDVTELELISWLSELNRLRKENEALKAELERYRKEERDNLPIGGHGDDWW